MMRFRHEMAELLGEKVGPDDSGDVYNAGGLASYYTGPKELFPGKGKFGHLDRLLPVIRWYDPAYYFNPENFHPGSTVTGEFTNEQCVTCHTAENPGIVTQWRQSQHGTPPEGKEVVGCGVCHSGPEQYEYEMYMQSYHGMIYQGEGQNWDWTKPLNAKNYVVPTCAYCHMQDGEHNVTKTSTVYTFMGTSLVDRGAYRYKATRDAWINTCKGCHSPRFARDHLVAMDEAVQLSFTKYREAMGILMALYADNLIDPMPIDLAPDSRGHNVFSLMPGKGEMRKYNVSNIERLTYEMLVDIIGAIFKEKAHNTYYSPIYGYWEWAQDRWLIQIKDEASKLKRFAEIEEKLGIKHTAYSFWKHGEYTDMLLGWKRKEWEK